MKLFDLISVLAADETIIIRKADDMIIFCGKIWDVYAELDEDFLRATRVDRVFSGFGGLVIETNAE
jgi:hypothetical protein